MSRLLLFISISILISVPRPCQGEDRILTLWPLVDYRHGESAGYTSLNLLGPLVNFERKGSETEFNLRPFYFSARDSRSEAAYREYLYPVARHKVEANRDYFNGLNLLQYDAGPEEVQGEDEFTLFPLLFYGRIEGKGNYFALFPLGGKLYEKFGREEIRFTLFPLYGRTLREGTTITNILWPVYARVEGQKERGTKLWPLYGRSEKEGVYRKRFWLWPIFFRQDLHLDTPNPVRKRIAFPFYLAEESPRVTSRTVLWPFFRYREDRGRHYEEWNFPWPLFGVSRGEFKHGERFLPLYSRETIGDTRHRWFLWPLFKYEHTRAEYFERETSRVLFLLFTDRRESYPDKSRGERRRISLWPLFTYRVKDGVARFQTLSLLEPIFPGNEGFERNWSPLWALYLNKKDQYGNEISSLLWNLYWKEKRGEDLAMEIFPLVFYRRVAEERQWQILKGLVSFRTDQEGSALGLFYLPWRIEWDSAH